MAESIVPPDAKVKKRGGGGGSTKKGPGDLSPGPFYGIEG